MPEAYWGQYDEARNRTNSGGPDQDQISVRSRNGNGGEGRWRVVGWAAVTRARRGYKSVCDSELRRGKHRTEEGGESGHITGDGDRRENHTLRQGRGKMAMRTAPAASPRPRPAPNTAERATKGPGPDWPDLARLVYKGWSLPRVLSPGTFKFAFDVPRRP